jgi:hypothetical protein
MFSKTVSVLYVPFEQLQMMTATTSNGEYRASQATASILVWYIQPDTCNSSAFAHIMQTAPLATHVYPTQIHPPQLHLPPLDFVPSSSSSSSMTSSLLSCFDNTVIFKRDKSNNDLNTDHRANSEVDGLNVFPRWKTPFVITAAFRAFYYKPPDKSTSSASSSSLTPAVALIKHYHAASRLIEQHPVMKRLKTSSSADSSSNGLSSVVDRERRGVILERCVGSLHDGVRTDKFFNTDMTLRSDITIGSAFTWQLTHHVNHTRTQQSSRSSFDSLCRATCQLFVAQLRDLHQLYYHFHHLCECVRYMHERGVVHGDVH